MMTRSWILISIVVLQQFLLNTFVSGQEKVDVLQHTQVAADEACALRAQMRKLWDDHALWTRNVILCLVDNLPGQDEALTRLYQNQDEIGLAFDPYYGEAVCENVSSLLKEHIRITVEVVEAAKAGDMQDLERADSNWRLNADKIAELLSEQNKFWMLSDLSKMLNWHMRLTFEEVTQRLKNDYDADVRAFDKVRMETMTLSDMLSNGIIRQFSARFHISTSSP